MREHNTQASPGGGLGLRYGYRFVGAVVGIATVFLLTACQPDTVTVAPTAMEQVGTVNDRFLSYNVEMVEVTGGRFWRPYKDGKREGDDRYEYRPPLDLTDSRLIKFAQALGPSYVRISGTWANATYFDPENDTDGKPPAGFDTVLTGDQWRGVIDFSHAVDARIVTSFATSPGVRDNKGVWQSAPQAAPLIDFTKSLGAEIAAAEYANEPETLELTQAPEGYTTADYRRDYGLFYNWLREASPSTLILAPGAAELGQPTHLLRLLFSGYTIFDREELVAADQHTPDVVSFHFYGAGSQRCGESPLGHDKEDALSGNWLGQIDRAIATTTKLRDRVAPDAPLWITETAETACGGNPWAAMFTDVFRFTDQLARSARQGVKVYMHNTLSASDYGLLDETTHAPRPNYWAAWLWRTFMGTQVLDAGERAEGLHIYAHCLREQPGGVAVLAINLDEREKRTVRIPTAAELFSLREGDTPTQATLNGLPLQLGQEDSLPEIIGVQVQPGELALEPASVNYITFPEAGNTRCG